MRRTTIFADDDLINEIKEISKEENRSVAEIVRDAMQNYIKQKRHKKKKSSFIGIGNSGRRDIAEKHEERLWKKNKICKVMTTDRRHFSAVKPKHCEAFILLP